MLYSYTFNKQHEQCDMFNNGHVPLIKMPNPDVFPRFLKENKKKIKQNT